MSGLVYSETDPDGQPGPLNQVRSTRSGHPGPVKQVDMVNQVRSTRSGQSGPVQIPTWGGT